MKDVVKGGGGDCSGEVSDSNSSSESDSKSCSDSDSHDESDSGSEHSSEKSTLQPSNESSSKIPADQTNLGKTSPQESDPNVPPKCTFTTTKKCTIDKAQANRTKQKSLETLRNFNERELSFIWHDSDIFIFALERTNLVKNRDYLANMLSWAVDLIFYRKDEQHFSKSLATYTRRYSLDNNLTLSPTPAVFDNFLLYNLAGKVWSHAIKKIEEDFDPSPINR